MTTVARSWGLTFFLFCVVFLTGCNNQVVTEFNADYHRMKAYDAYRDEDYGASQQKFEQILEKRPRDIKSHFYLGQIALNVKSDPSKARFHFRQAYTMNLNHRFALTGQEVKSATFVPRPTNQQIADGLAESIFQQQRNEELFSFLQKMIDDHGKMRDYLRRAQYLHRTGDHDSALTAYQTAIKIGKGKSKVPYLAFAEFYDDVNDRAAALIQLRIAYGIDPTDLEIQRKIREHGSVPGPSIVIKP